jgi:protein gp37
VSDHTHIEWTDATWNPITGCSVVSAGCKHCYAMKLAGTRLAHHPSRAGLTIDTKAGPVWTGEVRFNSEWLDQPLRWRRPRRIFVCAHGDLFHESVPDEWIDQVFAVMAMAPQHTFQVLTKRPERMRDYLAAMYGPLRVNRLLPHLYARGAEPSPAVCRCEPLRNVWLGVSVEDQAAADERIPLLLQCHAAVRWISAEPLLGPVDLTNTWPDTTATLNAFTGSARHVLGFGEKTLGTLGWVVAGGESGTGARPMHPDWARSLRDQCKAAGVPFLFKQWGNWLHDSQDEARRFTVVDDRTVHEWPDDSSSFHVGKIAAGRHLDGVLHDGYPAEAA